ncbi:hypothetical protein [Streptomyces sp. NPDC056821]|uniref:hypothetical protein n=1 Tax=Streptomyces sp. NPDC056821 TaxID=3345952 RepID=UPI0036AA5925
MGDRYSDGGGVDRRRAGTGGRGPGGDGDTRATALEPALRSALCAEALDASAEQRAVAAFRAARAEGVHQQARVRRRDDWRPRRVPGRRSVRAAIAVFFAGLTFSGVAIAAIGSPKSDGKAGDDDHARRHPSPTAPQAPSPDRSPAPAPADAAPSGPASPTPVPSVTRDHPPTAKDIQAHCRAYAAVKDRGKALESTAWKRFIEAAGGEDNVDAYCADQLAQTETGNPGKGSGSDNGNVPGSGNSSGSGNSPGSGSNPGSASDPSRENGQPNGNSAVEKNAKNAKTAKNEKNGQTSPPGRAPEAGAAKTGQSGGQSGT